MAEIPVERNTKSGFPWWLIPLFLLLLLLPLIWYCSRNTAVVDNTNGNMNGSANRTMMANNAGNNGNLAVVVNNNSNGNGAVVAFNEEERIRTANERAAAAMAKIYPNGTAQQVIEVLNLSAINFPKGSAVIPEANKSLLKQAAEQLKKSPADTRVQIDGHTDNDGDDASNQKLSQQRAEAVRSEMVKEGIPAAMLSTKGYGEIQPKASNDTPEGRFENRRIEYKVATSNTTVEKVAPNSNAGK